MTQNEQSLTPVGPAPLRALVLGAGYAGVLAANRLGARLGPNAQVTLVAERPEFVHRIRLHEALAGRPLQRYLVRELLPPSVALESGRAARVDAAKRTVTLADGRVLTYDFLIVALGSKLALKVPGAREHAGFLASTEAALEGSRRLEALPAQAPVVVVGGGLTAIEAATEIAEAHPRLQVSLLAPALAPALSETGRAYLRQSLGELGVRLREGVEVQEVRADAVALVGQRSDPVGGEVVPSALTVWGGGFEPAGPAVEGDLPHDARGRIVVGPDLRVPSAPEVFVAGDAAAPPPGMEFLRMGCASAMPMGAHAADGVLRAARGRPTEPHRFGFAGQCISLGRHRALVQRVDARDRPMEQVLTGRSAALVKELICRYVVGALRLERRWAGAYLWPGPVTAQPQALLGS